MRQTLVAVDTPKLRHVIRTNCITYGEVAAHAGVSERTVLRTLARGACSPRSLDEIACGLGTHPTELKG